ncbi:hypothetical protein BH18THE1_BH18THE1_20450 [soil metagenome]
MLTNIQEIVPLYSQFELILPEEIKDNIKSNLEKARIKFIEIQASDLASVKNLLDRTPSKKNKGVKFDKFEKDPHYIIKMAFKNKNEVTPNEVSFHFAHWYTSKVVIKEISENLIRIFASLLDLYKKHKGSVNDSDKRRTYFDYVRTYQDFYGYLISMRNLIEQYHDNFVILCRKIDPKINANTIVAATSDTFTFEFFGATKELLLHGNYGRLAGFPLLRSAAEVGIFGGLFDLKYSNKYSNMSVVLKEKIHLDDICRIIEKKNLNQFPTDTLRRLYGWQSIVSHRGLRTKEYVLWFVYYYVGGIINAFSSNLRRSNDSILEELEQEKLIEFNLK